MSKSWHLVCAEGIPNGHRGTLVGIPCGSSRGISPSASAEGFETQQTAIELLVWAWHQAAAFLLGLSSRDLLHHPGLPVTNLSPDCQQQLGPWEPGQLAGNPQHHHRCLAGNT